MINAVLDPGTLPEPAAGRGGTSSIGTTSPNTGAAGNTNSTYGQGAFASGIAIQPLTTGVTYTLNNTDYQGFVIFNTASAITVTLNQTVKTNFEATILNLGAGTITLTPNGGLLVNGASSLTLSSTQGAQVFFANRTWYAFVGSTVLPVISLNGVSSSIGGSALILGQVVTTTVAITGAAVGMVAMTNPETYPGDGFFWDAYISASNTVTVRLICLVAGTPTSSVYSVRILQ